MSSTWVDIYYIRLGGITGTGNYHRKNLKLPNYYDLSTKDWLISIQVVLIIGTKHKQRLRQHLIIMKEHKNMFFFLCKYI